MALGEGRFAAAVPSNVLMDMTGISPLICPLAKLVPRTARFFH
jgi:hypothetical protein